jgi:flavin reductase (DIM6/NTAB) family NADH-FMN oxidoreductase RutF/DNA-binding MarR family transcriptional regulator
VPFVNIESLRVGSSIYTSLAVLQAALRPVAGSLFVGNPFEVGPNEFVVLQELAVKEETLSLAGISRFLAASRASGRQVVGRLSKGGLIAGESDPEDRRLKSWQITPAGEAELARLSVLPSRDHPLLALLLSLPEIKLSQLCTHLASLVISLEKASGDFSVVSRKRNDLGSIDLTSLGGFAAFWQLVTRAYRRIRTEQTKFFQQATDQVLDTAAYMTLYRVHEAPSSMAEVAAFLRVDQNTAIRMVDWLEQHGLLNRTRNPSSRRELTISATEKGVRLLKSLPPVDPDGDYLRAVDQLPGSGVELDELLKSLVHGFVGKPIVDHEVFYALLKSVTERESSSKHMNGGDFRAAMSQFLTGVAVVTVQEKGGPRGITVNSLTSVSLDPPILLVCFDRRSVSLKALHDRKSFGVSILNQRQQSLAARFGRRETKENPHTLESDLCCELSGVPTIAGALAQIVCELQHSLEAGTHTVIFGAPRQVAMHDATQRDHALGFWRSKFVDVAPQ